MFIELAIYSGQENPTYELNDEETASLRAILDSLSFTARPVQFSDADHERWGDRLGYSRIVIEETTDKRYDYYAIRGPHVYKMEDYIRAFETTDQAVEDWVRKFLTDKGEINLAKLITLWKS